jgi:hypothetical protein
MPGMLTIQIGQPEATWSAGAAPVSPVRREHVGVNADRPEKEAPEAVFRRHGFVALSPLR